ncbi:glycosyl hydrolase [Brevundimonas sp. MYb46]|nr:glycosyl hydrolase [Brevundimonas sp. MYb31]PRA36021.1 glycosyl hydrolase [Brevundimonas sp. MYb27]PRB17747.1 glycosyl hydrolase [Brevundimonas sp. MYb52]PRB38118.1 glycosyl hydrolase [Brevundimonas sp. MYb46]PRB56100.1 glycosyl hydrolase [Brevundimonas sp. MYb33]
MTPFVIRLLASSALLTAAACATIEPPVQSPSVAAASAAVDVDRRAAEIVDAMTLDEQVQLLRTRQATDSQITAGPSRFEATPPVTTDGTIRSAGYVAGVPRLNWPQLQLSDGPLGVANMKGWIRGIEDQATNFPASLAWAATFDPDLIERVGETIGAEAHAKGFNVMLAGGLNLAREPRNGRNFEYAGEDPLLAGRVVGANIAGIQSQHVVSTVKHFAFNDQESGRGVIDVRVDEAGARESDLLAFEIAIDRGQPGSVMCAYNRLNGDYTCQNDWLLNQVLKGDWGYRGWVMSDWGGVHDFEKAVEGGLDQHSPQETDYFADLAGAVARGQLPASAVRDRAFRIVRSMIAVGALEHPATPGGAIDREANSRLAQHVAETGAVLLKNDGGLLPLEGRRRIVVIGGEADRGVLVGGGGSMVNPWGGIRHEGDAAGLASLGKYAFVPSSPVAALQALRSDMEILYDDGSDPARAATAAAQADVAIVIALKQGTEAFDSPDLSLPRGQDDLIAAVAAANPRTVVVLETGNPVLMPWLESVPAVLQAWYPGQRGGEAIARLLTGVVSPSGRLPMTFPRGVEQLPRVAVDGYDPKATLFSPEPAPFSTDYHEGSDVGYRWFERTRALPLFPFGFGLTYTDFVHSDLRVEDGDRLKVTFTVKNTGQRSGVDTPQLYVAPPGRTHRLAGWARVALEPGESRRVTIEADPWVLASYENNAWRRDAGSYGVRVSMSAGASGLQGAAQLTQGGR